MRDDDKMRCEFKIEATNKDVSQEWWLEHDR
jgi:hypothetical protein